MSTVKDTGGQAGKESTTHVHVIHDELVEGSVDVELINCSVGHGAVEGGEHVGQSGIVSCGQVGGLRLQEVKDSGCKNSSETREFQTDRWTEEEAENK